MSDDLTSNVFDTALIFEGGGMRASYTCALANVLLENDIFIDNVYGLSAGASNSVNYVSRDMDRTRKSFIDLVKDPEFGGLSTFLQRKGYFSAKHIYQEAGMPDGFLPFDMKGFLANPAKVTIQSFDRDTGEFVYWTKDDLSTLEDLMVRVRASSTLPLIMPPPKIGDSFYYDGGLGEGAGFMLPRAQHDGFSKFLVVRTRPKEYRKPAPDKLSDKITNAMLWRRPKVVEALDSRWMRYNQICDEIEQLEQQGDAYVFYANEQAVSSGETNIDKLQANYDTGRAQAEAELPAIKEFLGLA